MVSSRSYIFVIAYEMSRYGEGNYYYSSGAIYKGSWKNNVKEGKGIFKWADGASYEGEFKNNVINGKDKNLNTK